MKMLAWVDLLTDVYKKKRRKKCIQYKDSHRVGVDINIEACNLCGGWEIGPNHPASQTRSVELPIIHEVTCSFYPSPANLALENTLRGQGSFKGSKWDTGIGRHAREAAGITHY